MSGLCMYNTDTACLLKVRFLCVQMPMITLIFMIKVVCLLSCRAGPLQAASFQGTPLELSYWVSHNLPLHVCAVDVDILTCLLPNTNYLYGCLDATSFHR